MPQSVSRHRGAADSPSIPLADRLQAPAANLKGLVANPQLQFQRRDIVTYPTRSGGTSGPLESLRMLLHNVPQAQLREPHRSRVIETIDWLAPWTGARIAVPEDPGNQFAFRTGKEFKRVVLAIIAGQERSPKFQTWHDTGMGTAQKRRSNTRFERFPLGRPWCEALRLQDGRKLIARPILSGDAATLRRSFGDLTAEEIRFRFLHPITELTPAYARELSDLDWARAFALVIVEALPPEEARIGAVARAIVDAGGKDAEFAIIVGREIGGFGLGTYLLKRISEWSRKKGMRTLYGDVMVENQRMLRLARRLGFKLGRHPVESQLVRIWRPLRSGALP